jgi:hypothetical protein
MDDAKGCDPQGLQSALLDSSLGRYGADGDQVTNLGLSLFWSFAFALVPLTNLGGIQHTAAGNSLALVAGNLGSPLLGSHRLQGFGAKLIE